MTSAATRARVGLPPALRRRFEAVVFDWDGTAVPDRAASAATVRGLVERLSSAGLDLVVVSGTNLANVDGQLAARPVGPGRLLLCLNRGSEVFEVLADGPHLLERRAATRREDAALTRAAALAQARLAGLGLETAVVSARLNRRKLDLIPLPEWAEPPKDSIGELLEAVEARLAAAGLGGLADAVAVALAAAGEAGLPDARVTSDVKHVEVGLTDKADAARWAFADLRRRGIAAGDVLVVGDEFGALGGIRGSDSLLLVPEAAGAVAASVGREPTGVPGGVVALGGGPDAFAAVLADQLTRRSAGEPPTIAADDAWVLTVDGCDPELERVDESLLALADGRVGTRGAPAGVTAGARPGVFVSGAYAGTGPDTALLAAPLWERLPVALGPGSRLRRRLDLRTGRLAQELLVDGGRIRTLSFASLARPGLCVLRAEAPAALAYGASPLAFPDGEPVPTPVATECEWAGGDIHVAAREHRRRAGGGHAWLDRLAAYGLEGATPPTRVLDEADRAGWERLHIEQRAAWAQRWEACDVRIAGDRELTRAVRFSLFHLMASAADEGEAAVGARDLTGSAYRGHVFWDTDVFVLPFLAATHPAAARAALEYRIRRLGAARAEAAERGFRGARFPWESAGEGRDVTPRVLKGPDGEDIAVLNGEAEEHITADVAWAVGAYLDWTGDEAFRHGAGLELLAETARYWASRVRVDDAGRAHLDGVIGPDEYHVLVDDNAYTNVMARWNLRRAAAEAERTGAGPGRDEIRAWRRLADALVDGYDAERGLYEQFAGFFELEPLVLAELVPRPAAADVLLGRERVERAQVVKQADVLMLHHLVPTELEPGSLARDLAYYEPRTAHGSSLSPGIHAALLARVGELGRAQRLLRLTARLDLDDVTETTAGGLHLATMGSLWQALALGFAGVRPLEDALALDPRIPPAWGTLELALAFRGVPARLTLAPDEALVETERPLRVRVPNGGVVTCRGRTRFARGREGWAVA
ncbi:MAG TPA: glycosyl hydrolase family 65 protein [Gaiellaceae bacterium]|nr:glycosyl hydrolase family 65 protein [Gaiellaceae bacterium]